MNTKSILNFLFLFLILKFSVMEAEVIWHFPAIPISDAGEDAGNPQVAIDGEGNAVAVWARFNGTNYIIQGSTFNSQTSSWSPSVDLSAAGQNADLPQLSINTSGKAIAVWSIFNGNNDVIQTAMTQTPTNTWSSAINLSKGEFNAQYPQVGVDNNGDGVAIWEKALSNDPSSTFIEGALLKNNMWSSPVPVSQIGVSSVSPRLAVNPLGQAVAVWRSCSLSNGVIYGATFNQNSGWSSPIQLSENGLSASIPQVGIDGQGNAIAVWRRTNGVNFIIQASTLLNGMWFPPINLSAPGFDADQPQIAVELDGQAIAAWSLQLNVEPSENTIIQSSESSTYDPNIWSQPTDFTTSSEYGYSPHAAINQLDAGVIWSIANCINSPLIQADSPAVTLQLAQTATLFGPADPADESRIAISSNKNVVAVWRGFDGLNNRIWAITGVFPNNLPEFCITPFSGPEAGGTIVILTGSHLTGATAVYFGGTLATSFNVLSDSSIEAVSPPGTGSVYVTVITSAGTSPKQICDLFTYIPPFVPDFCISPSSGPEVGGTIVTLTGDNLAGTTAVSFGGIPAASFTVNPDGTITAVSPPGIGSVYVTVTTSFGASLQQPCILFTYVPPLIPNFCIFPDNGLEAGGTTVTLTGNSLTGATAVSFGGTSAASFTVNSDGTITAVSPPGTGSVYVTVMTPFGISPIQFCDLFTYLSLPIPNFCLSPTNGPEKGGTVVTLAGDDLTGVTAVSFGGTPAASFTINPDGTITAISPPGIGAVYVTVTTPTGMSPEQTCTQFTYFSIPFPPKPKPPKHIHVTQVKNRFATQTDLINIVKWSPSSTPGVTAYYLYRNGHLIAKIPAHAKLVFKDHNRKKRARTVYAVTALIGNIESLPTKIVFKK